MCPFFIFLFYKHVIEYNNIFLQTGLARVPGLPARFPREIEDIYNIFFPIKYLRLKILKMYLKKETRNTNF